MQAGKSVDAYACVPAHCCQQSVADQAYAQAWSTGTETWIALPREAWPPAWFYEDGSPMYDQPAVQLWRALSGHPDAGTFWEQHCDADIVKIFGFEPAESWPSCYYHSTWQLLLTVYVDGFKMSGPETYRDVAWTALHTYIEIGEPAEANVVYSMQTYFLISRPRTS